MPVNNSSRQKLLLISLSALTLAILVNLGLFFIKQSRQRMPEIYEQTLQILFAEAFEVDLSQWEVTAGGGSTVSLSSDHAHNSSKSLKLHFDGTNNPSASHIFPTPQTGTLTVWFYDNLDTTMGTWVAIYNETGNQVVLLGVNTRGTPNSYTYRAGKVGAAQNIDSHVPRSVGWHKFEFVVTPKGSYGKIDGINLSYLQSFGDNTAFNVNLTAFSRISFASTYWQLANDAYYDDLQLQELFALPSSIIGRDYHFIETFIQNYENETFTISSFPADVKRPGRTLVNTALAFAIKYRREGGSGYFEKVEQILREVVANNRRKFWGSPTTAYSVGLTSWLVWHELGQNTKQAVKEYLFDEANYWAGRNPGSGYIDDTKAEENAWTAEFLALVSLMFPDETGIIFTEDFEVDLSQWEVTAGGGSTVSLSSDHAHNSSKSLKLHFDGTNNPSASHIFPTPQTGTLTVWFYDNMDATMGTFAGIFNGAGNQVVLLGVNTNEAPNSYIYRAGEVSLSNIDSQAPRSLGWHKFEFVSTPAGSYGKIDGIDLSAKALATSLTGFSRITLVSTWQLASDAYYDDLQLKNANNSQLWDQKAKLYAWHTFTRGESYGGITTQTLHADYRLANHSFLPHPHYAYGASIGLLGHGALIYKKVGKEIPSEFKHNVENVWQAHEKYFDYNTYLLTNCGLSDQFGGKDDWATDATSWNNAFIYFDIINNSTDLTQDLTEFEYYIRHGLNFSPKPYDFIIMPTGTTIYYHLRWLFNANMSLRHTISLLFLDDSLTLPSTSQVPTPTPTSTPTPTPTSTPTPTPTPTLTPTPTPHPVCDYDYESPNSIGVEDLIYVLANWDSTAVTKLLAILANWGTSCS